MKISILGTGNLGSSIASGLLEKYDNPTVFNKKKLINFK